MRLPAHEAIPGRTIPRPFKGTLGFFEVEFFWYIESSKT